MRRSAAGRCVQDPATRCYPIYECQEGYGARPLPRSESESGTLLGLLAGDKLAGVCELFFEEETRYLLVTALYAWDAPDAALEAFLSHIDTAFKGYVANVGAPPENACLAAALAKHGYVAGETCFDLRYDAVERTPQEATTQGITLLEDETDDGFEEYAPLHDAWFPDDYWDSARLRELQGDWQALTLRGKTGIEGALFILTGHRMAEIYALHAESGQAAKELLKAMLWQNETAEFGVNEIVFLAQSENETHLQAALACGFTLFGRYTGWKKTIDERKKSIAARCFLLRGMCVFSGIVTVRRTLAGGVDLLPAGGFLGALAHMPRIVTVVRNGGDGKRGDRQAEENDIDRADAAGQKTHVGVITVQDSQRDKHAGKNNADMRKNRTELSHAGSLPPK